MTKKSKRNQPDEIEQIKRHVLIAIVSEDELMERLVLKGGSALGMVHDVNTRASRDLDFSMENSFCTDELKSIEARVEHRLKQELSPAGYLVTDVEFREKPREVSPEFADFWGGYALEFKLVRNEDAVRYQGDPTRMQKAAIPLGAKGKARFEIDISKHEYCGNKQAHDFGGYTVFVYSPEMIVCEKLRALCQQMPAYCQILRRSGSPRPRDLLDIVDTIDRFSLEIGTAENLLTLQSMFAAKRVPMELLARIAESRELHASDWPAVEDTVRPGVKLEEFDYYFDKVVDLGIRLHSLWHKNPPPVIES